MIKVKLTGIFDGEEYQTEYGKEEEITSINLTYNVATNETIVNAFNSDVELFRMSGRVSEEDATETAGDYYDFEILDESDTE